MCSQRDTHERLAGDVEIHASSDQSFGVIFGVVFFLIGLWPLLQARARDEKQEKRRRLDHKHAFELD